MTAGTALERPKLLDLYCCEGGAGVGYERAGFDVYAVDLNPKVAKRNPFPFHAGSALAVLETLIAGAAVPFTRKDGTVIWLHLGRFAAIHASPPCQGYTIATAGNPNARAKHERLIAATRTLLEQTGLPWVIENVEQAKSQMIDPTMLCGRMFGLGTEDEDGLPLVLDRHRLFESNIDLHPPEHPKHGDEQVGGVYGGSRRAKAEYPGHVPTPAQDRYAARHERGGGYVPRSKAVQQRLLGIDWMTVRGMQESIPPAYAEHVGAALLAAIGAKPFVVVDVEPNTDAWLDERQASLGASDMGAVMGAKAYDNTALTVYLDKIGVARQPFDPVKSMVTHAAEPIVAEWFAMRHPYLGTLREGHMARSTRYPWLHATFDYWLDQPDGTSVPFQVKTASPYTRDEWREGVPAMYVAQEDAEMLVAGVDEAFLAVWFWGSDPSDFVLHHMTADPERRERLIETTRRFWFDHVGARVAPPPTIFDDLASIYPGTPGIEVVADQNALDAWELCVESSLNESESRGAKKDAQAELELFLGDATELVHPATGKVVHSWRPNKNGVRSHRNH